MIQEHETWGVYDSTKLQSFLDCPRQHFYEYVVGWRPEAPNVHLEFGSAWHLAMETLILEGYTNAAIANAHNRFMEHYRQFFDPQWDSDNHPKNPGMALLGLVKYCEEYMGEKFEPVYTEIAGTVPMSRSRVLHFKLDTILLIDGLFRSREHKTAGQLSRPWIDQWQLKTQVFAYNHVLYCLYSPQEVYGVEINGAIFSKKEVKFHRIPVRHTLPAMEAWFWEVNDLMDRIDREYDRMSSCKEEDTVMECWPRNTESCTKYFGCRYIDFCMAWPNPLRRIHEPQAGFIVKRWDPREEEAKAKTVFHF